MNNINQGGPDMSDKYNLPVIDLSQTLTQAPGGDGDYDISVGI